MKTIEIYSDSGHAWGKVELGELYKLGIIDKISSFSYVKQSKLSTGLKIFVYLEEDCDLHIYIKALKEKGIEYKFKEHYANKRSKIRGYNSFLSEKYIRSYREIEKSLENFLNDRVIIQKVGF